MQTSHEFMVRAADEEDLPYICSLARRWTNEIGFLPRIAYKRILATGGSILVGSCNGQDAGFMVSTGRIAHRPNAIQIYQAAVPEDLQRRELGTLMLTRLISQFPSSTVVMAWCAEDLEANQFWEASGFQKTHSQEPRNARKRRRQLWQLPLLPNDRSFELYAPPAWSGRRGHRLPKKGDDPCQRSDLAAASRKCEDRTQARFSRETAGALTRGTESPRLTHKQ